MPYVANLDRSSEISNDNYWKLWLQWEPLVNKIYNTNCSRFPLWKIPGYKEKADVIGFFRIEMRRLGVFTRFNPSKSSNLVSYLSFAVRNIMRHEWEDYKRTYNGQDPISYEAGEASEDGDERIVEASISNAEPSFAWSIATGDAALDLTDRTEEDMLIKALSSSLDEELSEDERKSFEEVAMMIILGNDMPSVNTLQTSHKMSRDRARTTIARIRKSAQYLKEDVACI